MRSDAMWEASAADHPGFVLVARRNSSLGRRECQYAFGFIAFASFAIALGFAWQGAWMVLPFAGAEMAGLYAAFRWLDRHSGDYERVAIEGDRLIVETCIVDRVERAELNRRWAEVVVRSGSAARCLTLRSHGREVEFGRFLTDDERLEAARRLGDQLRIER